jgi:transcriptional regulator with PAS, ATPase and Fis domain
MLANWFLERCAAGRNMQISNRVLRALMQYEWPGNVRELENCIERAVALGDRDLIDLADMPPALVEMQVRTEPTSSGIFNTSTTTDLEDIERATIQRVFEHVKGDKVLAGKMLGISRATLYRKLKRYNIGMRPGEGQTPQALQ